VTLIITKFFPILRKSFAIGSVIACVFMGCLCYLMQKKDFQLYRERRRTIARTNIGGNFELINSKGETVKSGDFFGQWVLLYFGVTHCPDICPNEVERMLAAVDKYEKERHIKIQPIFISVDPDRDTPKVVEKYCKKFSDKIIGLTGTHEQVAKACKAYRVNYSNGPKDTDNDYIVNHTIMMNLVSPDGCCIADYDPSNTNDQTLRSIISEIQSLSPTLVIRKLRQVRSY
ncbi:hypothetical protein PV328_012379, partial [Microctonus aethiopoides]